LLLRDMDLREQRRLDLIAEWRELDRLSIEMSNALTLLRIDGLKFNSSEGLVSVRTGLRRLARRKFVEIAALSKSAVCVEER
jgi:hypothetical protein